MLLILAEGIESTPVALPDTLANEQVVLDVSVPRSTTQLPGIWDDPTVFVAVDTYASLDGGATWIYAGGFGAWGGVHVRKDGTDATHSRMSVPYPPGLKGVLVKTIVQASAPLAVTPILNPRVRAYGSASL